jgi:pimeloyl-ACP methyl ester carboxylesterase
MLRPALGDAPLFWVKNVGHIAQIEAPEAFRKTLDTAPAGLTES